jgi:dTDP-4-dehydrorhamnose reductase
MKILLTGAAGQLGTELLPLISKWGQVLATDRMLPSSDPSNWLKLDISDGDALENELNRFNPDLIVNTAAYTAVDQAEAEPQTAFLVNAELPDRLATWTKTNNSRLIHYSTDYIFNGEGNKPYLESDQPGPLSIYGESKLEGERCVTRSACVHATLRTSWVYSSHGKNFVLTMLALARKGLSLKIVDDQKGCPTWARNLALASDQVIKCWQESGVDDRQGVFHYCDDRTVSWYGFAQEVFRQAVSAGLLDTEPELTPVPSKEFPQPAKRPHWSVLDTGKIRNQFGISPVSFMQSIQDVLTEIKSRELQ